MSIEQCAAQFRSFAEQACRGRSPLYERLASRKADDSRLLEIAAAAPPGQPVPNLLLAAVHFLLLSGTAHELAGYYRSCTARPKPPDKAFPAFREFCLAHERPIGEVIAQRRVQTNEVRRCSYLLPAFCHIAQTFESASSAQGLALIEVGTSAGLNLLWDRYAYDYGDGTLYGNPQSGVRIAATWKGNRARPPGAPLPAVAYRLGIDLHVLDAADANHRRWLQALVWPDDEERLQRLTSAFDELRINPPLLVEGNALDVLADAIRDAPQDAPLCVFHCHTLNQFSAEDRQQFSRVLSEASQGRPLAQLSAEWIGTATPELMLVCWQDGQSRRQHLANVDQHGRWIEWHVDGTSLN